MAKTAARTVDEDDSLRRDPDPGRRQSAEKVAPRAGRTGGLGTRAERPSEGTQRATQVPQPHTGRGGKAPSAGDSVAPAKEPGKKKPSASAGEDACQEVHDSSAS